MAIGKILNIGSGGSGGSKDGSTAMPINDVVVWQKCAGIYNYYKYEVIGDILADTACMEKLFESDSANKYLMRSPTIFNTIINNADALAFMGNIHEVRNAIATTEWMSTAVGALGYDSYIKVFKHQNALGIADNTDSYDTSYGTINFKNGDIAKCSFAYIGSPLAMYDNNLYTQAASNECGYNALHYWYYTFSTDFILKCVRYCAVASTGYSVDNAGQAIQVEAYNEDTNSWDVLANGKTGNSRNVFVYMPCADNIKLYRQYRLRLPDRTASIPDTSRNITCAELTWIGVKPNVV